MVFNASIIPVREPCALSTQETSQKFIECFHDTTLSAYYPLATTDLQIFSLGFQEVLRPIISYHRSRPLILKSQQRCAAFVNRIYPALSGYPTRLHPSVHPSNTLLGIGRNDSSYAKSGKPIATSEILIIFSDYLVQLMVIFDSLLIILSRLAPIIFLRTFRDITFQYYYQGKIMKFNCYLKLGWHF